MPLKRPAGRRMRACRDLVARAARLPWPLPVPGAAVVGAYAMGAATGALYVQRYFEALAADRAVDFAPYSAIFRTGPIAGALAIALPETLSMVLIGSLRERALKMG